MMAVLDPRGTFISGTSESVVRRHPRAADSVNVREGSGAADCQPARMSDVAWCAKVRKWRDPDVMRWKGRACRWRPGGQVRVGSGFPRGYLRRMVRELHSTERQLVEHMLAAARTNFRLPATAIVESLNDGMGSLEFVSGNSNRRFGGEIAVAEFNDADGVLVYATLLLDQHGDLFELEMWKVDFSPLQQWPTPESTTVKAG